MLDPEHSAPLEPTVVVLTKPGSDDPTGTVHVSYKTEVAPDIPEYSFKQEAEDLRKHRLVRIGEEEKNIDMDIIQPYRKIIQHAGSNYYNVMNVCACATTSIVIIATYHFLQSM